jgi:chromosome segregation ATPase
MAGAEIVTTAAQKRIALKAYMAGGDAETAGAVVGMSAELVERDYLALARPERLSISRELLLEQLRTVQGEIARMHDRLNKALDAKSRSRGSADTALKNIVTSIAILIDKQDVLQKQLDAIESAMQGGEKRRAKSKLRVREG